MSWVFLTGNTAFKLKKPVKYSFLDFSTPDARKVDCDEEIRLNNRLAAGVYLDIVPLTYNGEAYALDGNGAVVDWLVKMRRLPSGLMLDHLIATGALRSTDVDKISAILAAFYRSADTADISPAAYLRHFSSEHAETRSMLTRPRFSLPQRQVKAVVDAVDLFITRHRDRLAERIRQGAVVEGHGDLRPEHICLVDPPVIFDCLEFNRAFRMVDPFDELAFLALECERLGAGWVGPLMFARIDGIRGAMPDKGLIAFYTAFRAALRARLAVSHLMEPASRTPDRWVPLACRYLEIAERALTTLPR